MNIRRNICLALLTLGVIGPKAALSDTFSASPALRPAAAGYDLSGLGRDCSGCYRFHEIPGTTARLFDQAAKGTREGQLGRDLERAGYVKTTGDCGSNGIVLFIFNNKLDKALEMANSSGSEQTTFQGSTSTTGVLQGGVEKQSESTTGYGNGWANPSYDDAYSNPSLRATATTRFSAISVPLFGKVPIPGDNPAHIRVVPGWAQIHQTPKTIGKIIPSTQDNFSSAEGYMRGPTDLFITRLVLRSGRVVTNQLIPLRQ